MTKNQALKKLSAINFSTPEDAELAKNFVEELMDSLVGTKQETKEGPWSWVGNEYCAMFKAKNPAKGGKVRESISRMKAMFAAFPEIRKEDVIATTKLYLSQTNSKYIRYPHFFLKKGQGADAIYEFADWYDKYLAQKEAGLGRTSKTNTIQ
jgi:hypothetical protein